LIDGVLLQRRLNAGVELRGQLRANRAKRLDGYRAPSVRF
jgi:hypothetical protein